jgi:hypothetical protein
MEKSEKKQNLKMDEISKKENIKKIEERENEEKKKNFKIIQGLQRLIKKKSEMEDYCM